MAQLHCQSFDSLSRKACLKIRPLSSQMEGTVTIVRLKATCWNQEWSPKVAGDGRSTPFLLGSVMRLTHRQWRRFTANEARPPRFGTPGSLPPARAVKGPSLAGVHGWLWVCQEERERGRSREIKSEVEREKVKEGGENG